ncbi:hypothetical protein ASPZODRAFT_834990 [Penicilliopsis zonata CBS 506.65]|uniref:Carboxylic ester hydrolase n=1 Tax=Penicilliopsis zonata CBS 506.65 TaxID=1073090 RepID=A0A1L9SAG4_9EURO|nr:hypothetical protein ASPZODRAFT_834990 [Penicilliopsis zonata CBS 506.65]OJJ44126.1 hypothetical protein ASPZODRAFT_834990 [Penicilliopsis zonata CBS 506.65]
MGDTEPSSKEPTAVTIGSLSIRGFVSQLGVANFLGIPYAEIPARFRQAKLLRPETLKGVHDGTKFGPRAPQPPDKPKALRAHFYEGVTLSETIPCSEFGCLNLNVYGPPEAVGTQQKLPVYVWIHGGGFTLGDGGAEYDGNFLTSHAIKSGKPMIYVGINYRLGYLGWLTSQELVDEAVNAGEKPFRNVGLLDQRLALQWIQQNISHFGGDPDNVTISGESAGAWSVLAHLRSDLPVCKRGIIMSCPSSVFADLETNQATFDKLVASAGVPVDAPATEKLAALRDMTFEQLDSLRDGFPTTAWDPEWLVGLNPKLPLEYVEQFPEWVESVIVGFTRDEFSLFGISRNIHKWTAQEIRERVAAIIPDQTFLEEVIETYGIDKDSDETARKGLFALASDSMFGIAPLKIGQYTKIPVCVYRFDQADVYEKSVFKGYAFHAIDSLYSPRFPALAESSAPRECRATADHHSKMLIDFTYGEQPWETYATGKKIMRFDGENSGLFECPEGLARLEKMMATKEKEIMFRKGPWQLLRRSS